MPIIKFVLFTGFVQRSVTSGGKLRQKKIKPNRRGVSSRGIMRRYAQVRRKLFIIVLSWYYIPKADINVALYFFASNVNVS